MVSPLCPVSEDSDTSGVRRANVLK